MGQRYEIPEPHGNVIDIRQRVTPPRHPSRPTSLFDWEDPDLIDAGGRFITNREIQLIAGVLRHARGHCPSPTALDDAIEILEGPT